MGAGLDENLLPLCRKSRGNEERCSTPAAMGCKIVANLFSNSTSFYTVGLDVCIVTILKISHFHAWDHSTSNLGRGRMSWKGGRWHERTDCDFGKLREGKDFTDVTLACEDGQQVEAHKVVLTSSSPFF